MRRHFSIAAILFALLGVCSCSGPLVVRSEVENSASDANAQTSRVVVVTGATGQQGGAVARELLKRGYLVRGLTRNPNSDRARALMALGAHMVKGDFGDPDSLRSAMAGAYGVFAMTDFWEHGFNTEVIHGRALVDAAGAEGVEHFVYSSVGSADENTGIPHFDSKFAVEQYLVESGLPYSIVRPVAFLDNWKYAREELMSGRLTDPRDPDSQQQWIATSDIGFFVGEALDHPDHWLGQARDIAGEQLTLNEFVQVVSEVLDRPVRYHQISWKTFEKNAGEEMTRMTRWFQEVGYSADVEGLRARYPGLTSARRYLSELGWVEL
nr:nmrA-like family domain-containing protein 1 [Nerophis lumbriciformis]